MDLNLSDKGGQLVNSCSSIVLFFDVPFFFKVPSSLLSHQESMRSLSLTLLHPRISRSMALRFVYPKSDSWGSGWSWIPFALRRIWRSKACRHLKVNWGGGKTRKANQKGKDFCQCFKQIHKYIRIYKKNFTYVIYTYIYIHLHLYLDLYSIYSTLSISLSLSLSVCLSVYLPSYLSIYLLEAREVVER